MEESLKEQNYLDTKAILGHLGIVPGQWIGDFGVGASAHYVVPTATAAGPEGMVVMFDVLKPALSGAMSRTKLAGLSNARAVWTNLEIQGGATGIKDSSLDGGLLINVLHQSTKSKDILSEVARMLKPGAKLLIAEWKPEVVSKIAPPAERRLASSYIEQLAQTVGFAPLDRFEAGAYHWGLVVVKT